MVALRKIKHGVLFLLSAILLSCAVLACTQIFSDKDEGAFSGITAEAATVPDYSSLPNYNIPGNSDMVTTTANWKAAMAKSNMSTPVKITLTGDWTAQDTDYVNGAATIHTSFIDPSTPDTNGCNYSWGALRMSWKRIVFDLNGHTIDRNLYNRTSDYNNYGNIFVMYGGTLDVIDSSGTNKGCMKGGQNGGFGGLIYISGATARIYGGTFTAAYGSTGGAIRIQDNTLDVYGGVFENIRAGSGGAIFGGSYSTVKIHGGTYQQNNASIGGAFFASEGSKILIDGAITVQGNTSPNGSVAYAESYSIIEISAGTFTNNKGDNGVFNYDGTATIKLKGNPKITGNFNGAGNAACDVHRTVEVSGAFTSGAKIAVSLVGKQATTNYGKYNTAAVTTYFIPSNSTTTKIQEITGAYKEIVCTELNASTANMVPVPVVNGGLFYNGSSQAIISGYVSSKMTASAVTSGATASGTNYVAENVGSYNVTFTPSGSYTWADGTKTAITVTANIAKVWATVGTFSDKTVTYNAKAQSLTAPTTTPNKGVSWALVYRKNNASGEVVTKPTDAGTYHVTATPTYSTDNYNTISASTATLTINKADLTVTLAYSTAPTYGGSAVSPTLTVKRGTTTITSGYGTVTYSIAANDQGSTAYPGKATINSTSGALTPAKAGKIRVTVSIAASGNYNAATKTVEVTVGQKDIKTNGSVADIAAVTYSRAEHKPTPAVTNTSKNAAGTSTTLTKDTDYTLSYSNNIKAGTATVTVTGKGNYKGTMTKTFTINKKALTANSTAANKTYNGNTTATVTAGTLSGVVSGDTVTFTAAGTFADKNAGNNKNVTVKYTLAGTDAGNYSMADKTVTANITAKSIATDGALNITGTYVYTGAPLTPTYTVTNSAKNAAGNSTTLTINTDYTVSITNNTNAGTATVTVTGKGNYNSVLTKDFTISKAQITAVECGRTWGRRRGTHCPGPRG